MVKSHYPERVGRAVFKAQKCVLVVRNPLDCITSLFNMVATGTHNYSISEADYVRFADHFDSFVQIETGVWRDFHQYWLD